MRKFIYPKGLVLGHFLESMANNGVEYSLKRGHGQYMRYFQNGKGEKVDVFGGGIRVSPEAEADLASLSSMPIKPESLLLTSM
nr:MAG TPA: hypothetical protein [Caudoviricetes sp.]